MIKRTATSQGGGQPTLDELRVAAAMPRFSAVRRARVAAVTIALGCVIGAATPILGFADEAQVPVEEQVVEHGQIAGERPEDTQATAGEQAEDEQVSQLEGLGMRGAASASARDAASVARAPLLESFNFNMRGAFVIPYGVDVPSWLNAQDNLFQDGIWITQKLSAQEVAEEHFGGAGPFVYADGVSSYPGGTVSLADVLAWAEYNADEVKPPSMDDIEGHVTMQEVDEPEDIVLAPSNVLADMRVSGADGESRALATSGAWGDSGYGSLVVWLRAHDGAVTFSHVGEDSSVAALSDTYALAADASFASNKAGERLELARPDAYAPEQIYVKLDGTTTAASTDETLYDGQVLRVEVRRDETAPQMGTIEVLDASGAPFDNAALWVDASGRLTVGSDGLTIEVQVSDPEGTYGEVSGIDEDALALELVCTDGSTVVLEPARISNDGIATFNVNADTLGAKTVDLAGSAIAARDIAGNETTSTLSRAPFFAPVVDSAGQATRGQITQIRLIDDQTQAPSTSISFQGDDDDRHDASGRFVSNASSVSVTLGLIDPFYSELKGDAAWAAADPVAVAVDGAFQAVDPAGFSENQGAYSLPLASLTTEGAHTVTFSYQGVSAIHAGLGTFAAQATETVLIDRTPPTVAETSFENGVDTAMIATMPDTGDRLLVSSGTELELTIEDPQADGVNEVAGVASATVAVPVYDDLDDDEPETQTFTMNDRGTVVIPLDETGYYDFDGASIVMSDAAGNEVEQGLGAVLDATSAEGASVDGVVVAPPSAVRVDLSVSEPEGTEVIDGIYYPGGSEVSLTVTDRWFTIHANTPAFHDALTASVTTAAGEQPIASDAWSSNDFESVGDNSWTMSIPFTRDAEGRLPDGAYALSFEFFGASDELEFVVDSTAPQLTDVEVEDVDPENVADLGAGRQVLVGTGTTLRVRVQDLLPRGEGDPAATAAGDEKGTSGLAEDGATVTIVRSNDAWGEDVLPAEERTLKVDRRGWAEIELTKEGVYDLEDISVHLTDACGNPCTITLAEYVAALPADEQAAWSFTSILVDGEDTAPAVELSLEDGADTPASQDPYYHRGEVLVRAIIEDPWFDVYRAWHADDELAGGTVRVAGTDVAVDLGVSLCAHDFTQQVAEDGSVRWVAELELPRAEFDPSRPVEGDYVINLAYGGIAGSFGSDAEDATQAFGVDYSAPVLGALTLSDVETYPLNEDDEPWGWLFAEEERISLAVTDNLSGVDGELSHFNPAGAVSAEAAFEGDEEGLAGGIEITLAEDGMRLYFDGSSIVVSDRAGNTVSTGDFSVYGDTNIPQGAKGVSIDTEAPEVTLSFDNNDVRNEQYYNAARTGTITVSDASFDLVMKHDPELAVGIITRDGRESDTLLAEDFERIVLDDESVVYRATYAFEDDADWTLSAQHTDPLGHASEEAIESFVIDTQAPVIMVEYDNDDVANAMYYKAPRHATITVRDRNFDPSLGTVSAQNLSGGDAPGSTGFSVVEPRGEWRATASFTGEQHYQLQVTATDLAGNAAEPYDSGEFVIDMTAPQVQIAGVESGHAYAGAVAPEVSFADTNLDAMGSTATLEGARAGVAITPNFAESVSDDETAKTIFLGSLPYEVSFDDVYTLTGDAIDLAGNTAQVSTVFSVNRFGSTYYFAPGSEGIAGAYLNEAQDVRIVEVNVSGLDTTQTRVELAHDDRAEELVAGEDFELAPNADAQGWSATTYTLPAELFDENGFYRVTLTSTDAAGNLSQNTMAGKSADRASSFPVDFAIDGDAPTASLVGVSSNEAYLDPEKAAVVDAGDSVALAQARVYVDGHEVAAWDATSFNTGDLPELELEVDGKPHTYVLEVRDRAGNISTATYENVLVTGDWLTFVLNTPELLMTSIGGAVVLLGIIAAVAYLVWRRRRRELAKRNPFGHGRSEG